MIGEIKTEVIYLDEPCKNCKFGDLEINASEIEGYPESPGVSGARIVVKCKHREVCKFITESDNVQCTSDGLEGVYERSGKRQHNV